MYLLKANGYEIPVIMDSRVKGVKLYGKWDTFEVKCNPSISREQTINFIQSKKNWMRWHNKNIESTLNKLKEKISTENIRLRNHDKKTLQHIIHSYVDEYRSRRGEVNKIFINKQMRKNWATCSSKRNITFNSNLCYLPEHLVKYIVYHEMCHLTVWDHSPMFYSLIMEEFPEYEDYDLELEAYNVLITQKLHEELVNSYKFTGLSGSEMVIEVV